MCCCAKTSPRRCNIASLFVSGSLETVFLFRCVGGSCQDGMHEVLAVESNFKTSTHVQTLKLCQSVSHKCRTSISHAKIHFIRYCINSFGGTLSERRALTSDLSSGCADCFILSPVARHCAGTCPFPQFIRLPLCTACVQKQHVVATVFFRFCARAFVREIGLLYSYARTLVFVLLF